jgi:hypothetical protein
MLRANRRSLRLSLHFRQCAETSLHLIQLVIMEGVAKAGQVLRELASGKALTTLVCTVPRQERRLRSKETDEAKHASRRKGEGVSTPSGAAHGQRWLGRIQNTLP